LGAKERRRRKGPAQVPVNGNGHRALRTGPQPASMDETDFADVLWSVGKMSVAA
jgi:hypothetical protein